MQPRQLPSVKWDSDCCGGFHQPEASGIGVQFIGQSQGEESRGTGMACIDVKEHGREYIDAAAKELALKDLPPERTYCVISLATYTPLAEAWERDWVMPLPSPMM